MATTTAQLQTQLDTLSLDITNTLQSGANVPGPVLAQLFTRHLALTKDLSALQAAGASVLRYGSGVPSNGLGNNNDVYRNRVNGDEYQKVNGVYVLQQNLKGESGYTPVAGRDYRDGEDGLDGNEIVDKTYAPTTSDNAGYKEGDQWFYTKSLTSYDRYAHINGQWRLVFQKAESTAPAPATNQAPVVIFTAPASGVTVAVNTGLTLTANATDDKAVTSVVFVNGATGTVLGTGSKNGNTYTLPYVVTTAGPLAIVANAYDGEGLIGTATVNITVQAAAVALDVAISIEPPTTKEAGQAVNFGYTASGGKAPYQHLVQATNEETQQVSTIGSAATPTYNTVWTPVTPGTYLLTDTVTDADGTQKISTVRSVTVTAAPVSTGDTDVSGPTIPAGTPVGITDVAFDGDSLTKGYVTDPNFVGPVANQHTSLTTAYYVQQVLGNTSFAQYVNSGSSGMTTTDIVATDHATVDSYVNRAVSTRSCSAERMTPACRLRTGLRW
jgi:hypothetical protein